jgi:hypothetical protein
MMVSTSSGSKGEKGSRDDELRFGSADEVVLHEDTAGMACGTELAASHEGAGRGVWLAASHKGAGRGVWLTASHKGAGRGLAWPA